MYILFTLNEDNQIRLVSNTFRPIILVYNININTKPLITKSINIRNILAIYKNYGIHKQKHTFIGYIHTNEYDLTTGDIYDKLCKKIIPINITHKIDYHHKNNDLNDTDTETMYRYAKEFIHSCNLVELNYKILSRNYEIDQILL